MADPRTPTAVQRVHAHVKDAVMAGEFAEGTMLSEGQIATAVGVSRTPVREAFVQLETLGYLRLYPKRGALVVPVSREQAGSVLDTRWVVERHGIERAAEQGTGPTVAGLRAAIADQRRHVEAADLPAFSDADREFHRVLVAATENPILIDLYETLRDRQRRIARGMVKGDATLAERFMAEHEAIADALEAGDAALALERLDDHLDEARSKLLS